MDNQNKANWKRHLPFYILEGIALIAVAIGAIFVYKATRVQKVNLNSENIAVNDISMTSNTNEATALNENNDYIAEGSFEPKSEEIEVDKDAITKALYDKYNGNFAIGFFGVDSREKELGKGTRSDSVMICMIDIETHEVKLVSIFRDTYLNLGNDSYNKCNTAYAIGGPEQALSMINKNTDLYVDQYVTIGFKGLIDAIDALGGIPVEVSEDELFHLNNYQKTMAEELGTSYTPVFVPGTQMLNGLQATAYCRIRYTAGNDFKRAKRQRDVVSAMLQRAGSVSLPKLTEAVTHIFPNIATSLDVEDIVNMLALVGDYEVTVSEGFPFEGMRTAGTIGSKGSCVIPSDLIGNVKKLHEVLYGEEDYMPSDAVRSYSARIKEDTEVYLNPSPSPDQETEDSLGDNDTQAALETDEEQSKQTEVTPEQE